MARKRSPLDDDEAVAILEAIARDGSESGNVRVKALNELQRIRKGSVGARSISAQAQAEDSELPPDPMEELDELAARRSRRKR